jgi:O-antigen/teichoic acid export membrane protein
MGKTAQERLLKGLGATVLGPLVTIMVQLVSVPVFLHSWGAKAYGEWLILSAIPTYMAFSDIGFSSVSANDMTMRVAIGDFNGALETFQSTWALISSTSLLVGLIFVTGTYLLPVTRWLNLSTTSPADARLILILLLSFTLVSIQADLICAGFRCEGNYAFGMFIKNTVRFTESLAVTILVAFHGTPRQAAATYLIVLTTGTVIMAAIMTRKSPWLRYGFSHASFLSTRRLISPAFAYMAFPAGNALSIQGMVLVIAALLGPIAVATFSTMRTLTRFGFQIMEAVKNSVWPELSAAYGTRNWALARKLHRVACQASLWMSLGSVVFLGFAGNRIIEVWTNGRIVMDVTAFRWLLVVIVANSFWYTSSVVTVASNTHERIAVCYLAGTCVSLILARFLIPHFGISGAAMSLLAIDLIVGWYVLNRSLETLRENASEFFASMFRLPELSLWK